MEANGVFPQAPGPKALKLGPAWVVTVSDGVSRKKRKDVSGDVLSRGLKEMGFDVRRRFVVPDEKVEIQAVVRKSAAEKNSLLVLTGGTGLGPRDVTPEAVEEICDRMVPGLGEALRSSGASKTPMSWLSRSAVGLYGNMLVAALPGSPRAVEEALAVLGPLLPHALDIARGGGHGD
ncbi:MAG: hypothetical protein A3G41_07850 [Elusimicrobia bacterium RIFCSPLOWO2_12_FULL_59_9]|nr:MAG: hypothetical protein A3G41_07850 [Elusimicrobia bacterium RIFCSPLOWO2_12_FULL_59_9]